MYKNIIIGVLSLVLMLVLVASFWQRSTSKKLAQTYDKLQSELTQARQELEMLKEKLRPLSQKNQLEETILSELQERDDLLPVSGVLGGTMKFRQVFLLDSDGSYFTAEFDDGHIMGFAVFERSKRKDGSVKLKRVCYGLL
ncbi:MAG: cell division protein ZapB [candidate division KSB1 bacterium]|nr:cell division protein ZapB [candidate division KSB1 bacterium]